MIRTSAHLYQRLWANLPRVAPLVLVAMLLVGMLVPVYADEVGWRLQERAGIDGVDKLYSEQCGPNTLAAPPWFMLPVRFYSSFFNQLLPDPFWLRVSGVAYAVVWVALLLLLIRRVTGAERRSTLSGLGCGLMGLGVMPWLLVWSRPEQPIILAATAGLLIALGGARTQRWGPMLIALLATVALSYHFKALVLMPLFIACIAATAPLRAAWWNRGLAIAAVGAMAMVGARYWFARLSCPDDVLLAAAGLKQNISLQLLTGSGSWFSAPLRLIANYNLPAYVTQAAPDITPMSNWLPAHLVTKPVQIGWCVAMILAWTAGYGLTVWALIDAARRRVRDARPWLALVVLGCASVWCVGQVVRNVYEASFVLPLLTLAMVLALSTPGLPARLEAATRGTARAIALALPLSALAVLAIYGPSLADGLGRGGYLPGRPYSQGIAGYPALRTQILGAARLCGIKPETAQGLLIDDVTYFALMSSRLPEDKISVLEPRWRGSLIDPIAYLKARGSSGIVVSCATLPADLRRKALRQGGFCCLGPAQW